MGLDHAAEPATGLPDQPTPDRPGGRVRRVAGGLFTIIATLGVLGGWANKVVLVPAGLAPGGEPYGTTLPILAESDVQSVNAPSLFVAPTPAVPISFTTAEPGRAAQVAIAFALAQIGLPYVWGGDGPNGGDAGFDCSGLTTAAYAAGGIDLPRTAQTQYDRGPHVPAGSPLRPGDLVFYGVPQQVHHVGLYLGGGRMVNAPTFGQPVQVAYIRWIGDDYLGATRPATSPGSIQQGPAVIAPAPTTPLPPAPTEFLAPPVPPEPVAPTEPAQPPSEAAAAAPGETPAADALAGPQSSAAPAGPESTPPASGTTPPADPTLPTQPTSPPAGPTQPTSPPAGPTQPTSPPATPSTPATPTPPSTTPPPVAAPTLTLPGGTTLQLVPKRPGPTGLPPAPVAAGTATLWIRTSAQGPQTIVIVLAPGALTRTPLLGTTITLQGIGDTSISRLVRSRTAMSTPTAVQTVAAAAPVLRVLLMATDPASGALVVVQAR